jgi:hypothetical protein
VLASPRSRSQPSVSFTGLDDPTCSLLDATASLCTFHLLSTRKLPVALPRTIRKMVRLTVLALLPALASLVMGAPILRRAAFVEQAYSAFQISDGVGGNAAAQANAVFVGACGSSPSLLVPC